MNTKTFEYEKPDNLVDFFEKAIEEFGNNNLFGVKNKNGDYYWIKYKEIAERVDNLRAGMAKIGIKKCDTVAVISKNRPEWLICSMATFGRNARFVPMYEKEVPRIWEYIIKDSNAKLLIVANKEIYEKVKGFTDKSETLEHIYIIDCDDENCFANLEKIGKQNPEKALHPVSSDISTLIYTSGTTGNPKGVLLTHGNITSNSRGGYKLYPQLDESAISLSILPWTHSYGQTAELYNWFQFGGAIGISESVETIPEDLLKIKPNFFIAVPRIFNKAYDAIVTKIEEKGGTVKKLFNRALYVAKKKRELKEKGKSNPLINFEFAILDKIVFKTIRDRFGGNLKVCLTASATMNKEVAAFFWDAGIKIYDCYGLSETSPAVTMNCPTAYKLGSVGRPIENIKVVIDKKDNSYIGEDGEIIVYGPNVMMGYNNKEEETKKVMTQDGGFRTGDRGRLDEEGFLYITGRIKEQYKLENGKYVYPASIEEDIRRMPYIQNVMIYGEGKPFNIALIIPEIDFLKKISKQLNVITDVSEIISSGIVKDFIVREIAIHLKNIYASYEIPKKVIIINDEFSIENGTLTQTLKLKRHRVIEKYKDLIESQYHVKQI